MWWEWLSTSGQSLGASPSLVWCNKLWTTYNSPFIKLFSCELSGVNLFFFVQRNRGKALLSFNYRKVISINLSLLFYKMGVKIFAHWHYSVVKFVCNKQRESHDFSWKYCANVLFVPNAINNGGDLYFATIRETSQKMQWKNCWDTQIKLELTVHLTAGLFCISIFFCLKQFGFSFQYIQP